MQLTSTLTCPECGGVATETMPTNACQFFYRWELPKIQRQSELLCSLDDTLLTVDSRAL